MFSVLPIDRRRAVALEPLGTKRKFWLTGNDGQRWLFKAEERGTGEDWAEKIVCELAALLGLPHVQYELAVEVADSVPGVVCASCTPDEGSLVLGNQLLQALDPAYPNQSRYHVTAHTVQAVSSVIGLLEPPPQEWLTRLPAGIKSASEIFAGYLFLDAWVANQDRHHENWAVFADGLKLAPTFDHGASLARNLSDEERHERLTSRDGNRRVAAFARRARSALYSVPSDRKSLTTVAAYNSFCRRAPRAAEIWRAALQAIQPDAIRNVVERVPIERMSDIRRQFTLSLLEENRGRLLHREEQ